MYCPSPAPASIPSIRIMVWFASAPRVRISVKPGPDVVMARLGTVRSASTTDRIPRSRRSSPSSVVDARP